MKVAVLGLGAMGARMAGGLVDAGFEVTVWNRSPGRVPDLVTRGARAADTPADAARGADVVMSMVRDDDASAAVWLAEGTGALAALSEHAIGVECSTVSLPHARALARAFERAGRRFVDAPLAGSRPQAEAGQLIFFAGGEAAIVDQLRQVLEPLAAAVHHAGGSGSGAAVKLLVNALFGAQVALVAELIGLADAAGIDAVRATEIVASTPVCSAAAHGAAAAMLARSWAPAFPIDLVAKDFALIERSAERDGAAVPLCSRVQEIYERALDAGFGGDNITGVFQLYDRAR